jgi:rhodanese-related sulfurtransferase
MALRPIPELDARAAHERIAAGEVAVLDVREDEEWAAGRIAGSVQIPVPELVARQDDIPQDAPLLVVCRTGSRSAWATEMLVRGGYDATNLAGGLVAWQAAGLPLDPHGGYVA